MTAPSRIRGIVFDKDGTLLDYEASWRPINAAAAALAARGDEALRVRLLALGGADRNGGSVEADSLLAAGSARDIARGWVESGAPFEEDALTDELDRLFREAAGAVVAAADLRTVFTQLSARGLSLGIASSDNEASIRATAERFGIAELTDFIAGYDSGHGTKPGPGMVLGFCRERGLAPAEVAVVGDNFHDIAMARSAGAGLAVGVLTGTGTRAMLSELADMCLQSIAELEMALDGAGFIG